MSESINGILYEDYVIVFWDKSKIQINYSTGEKLKQAMNEGKLKYFELGSSLYAITSIEKIIPKEEAYNAYPAEWEQLKQMVNKTSENFIQLESPKLND